MPKSFVFPPEIVEEIISRLDDGSADSRQSLKNCSLASSPFLHSSQKHLFSTICLEQYVDIEHLPQLLETLRNNPSLPEYVQHFVVNLGIFTRYDSLTEILNMLPGIRVFELKAGGCGELRWNSPPDSLRASIERVCSLPALHTIDIVRLSLFPLNPLIKNPNIKHLILWGVRVDDDGIPDCFAKLDSLHVVGSPTVLRQLIRTVLPSSVCNDKETRGRILSQLRVFNVTFNRPEEGSVVQDLLQNCPTIETFVCQNWNDDSPISSPGPLDLSKVPTMKTLHYKSRIHLSNNVPLKSAVCGILEMSTSPLGLEEVILDLLWSGVFACSSRSILHPTNGWSQLDKVLTGPNLPRLKKVVIRITMKYYNWTDPSRPIDESANLELNELVHRRDFLPLVSSLNSISLEITASVGDSFLLAP